LPHPLIPSSSGNSYPQYPHFIGIVLPREAYRVPQSSEPLQCAER